MASLQKGGQVKIDSTRVFVRSDLLFWKRQRSSEGERNHRHSTSGEDGRQEMTRDGAETSCYTMNTRSLVSPPRIAYQHSPFNIPIIAVVQTTSGGQSQHMRTKSKPRIMTDQL